MITVPRTQGFTRYNIGGNQICIRSYYKKISSDYDLFHDLYVFDRNGGDLNSKFNIGGERLTSDRLKADLEYLIQQLHSVRPEELFNTVNGFLEHKGCNIIESHIQHIYENYFRAYFYIEKEDGLDLDGILFALKTTGCKVRRKVDKLLAGIPCFAIGVLIPLSSVVKESCIRISQNVLIENKIRGIIKESVRSALSEGSSTIRDDYVYIIYDFKRECYDAAYGCDIFDDLRWNNVMLVGGPFAEWTDEVDRQVEQLQSHEREDWDKYHG